MGLAAAARSPIAVLIALTLLPALLGFAGERLRAARQAARRAGAAERPSRPATRWRAGWSITASGWPLAVRRSWSRLGALALPAKDLQLACPTTVTANPAARARPTT